MNIIYVPWMSFLKIRGKIVKILNKCLGYDASDRVVH